MILQIQQVSLQPVSERGEVADSEDVSQPESKREGAANSEDALVGDDDFLYGHDVGQRYSNLAEIGSLQLEVILEIVISIILYNTSTNRLFQLIQFRYLGERTKNIAYTEKIMNVFDKIIERQPDNGLWYNTIA